MRLVLIGVAVLIAGAAGYLLAWPTRFDPVVVAVRPHPGFTGPYAPNEALRDLRWLGEPAGRGPEDVWVRDGYAYTGLEDGRVIRIRIDRPGPAGLARLQPVASAADATADVPPGSAELVANTGGRPLGLQHDSSGNLVVADAKRGLLEIAPNGQVVVLANRFENRPLRFVDHLDIARDGMIYFSDASQRYGIDEYILDFLEGQATGRLFSFDPRTRELVKLVDGLAFANGVALGPDEDYVLVNESAAHRITRYWLKGPRAGTQDVFIEDLPGVPDNLSFNGRDLFWVAMPSPRSEVLDDLLASPFRRRVLYRLDLIGLAPQPTPDFYGCVLAVDLHGKVVATLQDPGGRFIHSITGVSEADGLLYFGSIEMDRIATLPTPVALLAQ